MREKKKIKSLGIQKKKNRKDVFCMQSPLSLNSVMLPATNWQQCSFVEKIKRGKKWKIKKTLLKVLYLDYEILSTNIL